MTATEALAGLLAFHLFCWVMLVLTRSQARKDRERDEERLDAAHNRIGGPSC